MASPPTSEPSRPPERRRGRKIALALLAALLAAAGIGYWKRIEIASAVAGYLLAGQALPPIAFEIAALEPDHARLTGIAVGSGRELRLAEAVVTYDGWDALLGGTITSVALRGLELDADLTGEEPLLGSLTGYIPEGGESAGPPQLPALPFAVTLDGGRLRVATAVGQLAVDIRNARYDSSPSPQAAANFTAALAGEKGGGSFALVVEEKPSLSVKLSSNDLRFADYGLDVRNLAFDGDVAFDGANKLRINVQLQPTSVTFRSLRLGMISGVVTGQPDDLRATLRLDSKGDHLLSLVTTFRKFGSRQDATVVLDGRAIAGSPLWSLLPTNVETSGESSFGLTAQISATGEALAAHNAAVTGRITANVPALSEGDLRIATLNFAMPLEASFPEPKTVKIAGKDIVISADSARYGRTFRLLGKPALRIPIAEASVAFGEAGIESGQGSAAFEQAGASATVESAGGQVVLSNLAGALEGTWKPDAPLAAKVVLDRGAFELPAYELKGSGAKATATLGGEIPLAVDWSLAKLEDTAQPARFTPLRLSGKATQKGETIDFTANAGGAKNKLRIAAKGRHSLANGKGTASLTLAPLEFAKDGFQPAELSPLLARLTEASGKLEGSAKIAWPNAKGLGSGKLAVSGFGATLDGVPFAGLDLALALDSLQPLSSPPAQRLTLARIDPGVPITDAAFDFQLLPGAQPKIALEGGRWSTVGGDFRVLPATLDPLAGDSEITIAVQNLALEKLFELVDVEGLSGTGTLSGALPFTYREGVLVLTAGKLAAEAPGVLRFRSEAAKQYLAGSGETVDLALRALEDFRYEELSATLDQRADGTTLVALSLLGHNPTVLEGHPFRFNINLETRAGELLAVFADSLRLSQGLIRQLWMKAP